MADDEEWKKLPTVEKVVHKSWKARSEGYKECIKAFPTYDEKSSDFSKYLGLVKKFVIDPNELVRAQGVEATTLFVENAHVAGKACSEVINGVILKCFNSKPKLKEMGMNLCLMYIEIDKQEVVLEELIKGLDNKQPKVVNSCVETLNKALTLFGSKVVQVAPLLKQGKKLVDHRDKLVRQSAKELFIEIYRWIKNAIRVPLSNINPVMLKELESEWDKLGPNVVAEQTRFLRSQKDLREKFANKGATEDEKEAEVELEPEVDAYDLIDSVEILSKLPKNFYDQIEAKKWQERKEMLEICEKLANNPKLSTGDYGDLLKALKKVVAKDTNILLVAIAIKCIGGIAKGLRKKFQPYALLCLEAMFERFKEKKLNVVNALKEASDAICETTSIPSIQESLVEFLAHKNPNVRSQVGFFINRNLLKVKASILTKSLLKLLLTPLLKNLDHGTPDVREGAYQAIAACWLKMGENKITPFLADVDKIKMEKIRDCAKALNPSDVKETSKVVPDAKPKEASKKDVKNPPKKVAAAKNAEKPKKVVKGSSRAASKPPASSSKQELMEETVLGDEEVEQKIDGIISSEEKSQILNLNWKERQLGLQAAHNKIKMLEVSGIPCQAVIKFISIKPGLKDSNFNCLNEKFSIIKYIAENGSFTATSARLCMNAVVDKISDIKCGASAKAALSSICEATCFSLFSIEIVQYGMSQRSPKIQSEVLKWLATSITEFGFDKTDIKACIKFTKTALSATQQPVRLAALHVINSLALYLGEKVMSFFSEEKPAIVQQIQAEIDKVKDQPKPKPTRGKKISSRKDAEDQENEEVVEEKDEEINLEDLVTRVDISSKITDALINKISNSNWKERKEGLENVEEILKEAKFVETTLGDLPGALKKRFKDSNKKLLTTTLSILKQLAEALGPRCSDHFSTFCEGMILTLADSNPKVRQASLDCMEAWSEKIKLSQWFANDDVADALANPRHTLLRVELIKWLADKMLVAKRSVLKSVHPNIEACVGHVFTCCEDRSSDVRSSAQSILPALIYHLSLKKMQSIASKRPASSKDTITKLLDAANEKVPQSTKPLQQSTKEVVRKEAESKLKSSAHSKAAGDEVSKKKPKKEKIAPIKKKAKVEEEVATSIFIPQKNGKQLRCKDERAFKTLKWSFSVPRDELVLQLNQQISLCMEAGVVANMFHSDSNRHLKFIQQLTEALESDWDATRECFDVILRWFTLRFYDKNTTIHIKSFEYLKKVFSKLSEENLKLSDYEANSFIPHLIRKIGDQKDAIRSYVHSMMELLIATFDEKKIYQMVMLETSSKNAKQRSACLDMIGGLIRQFGSAVCDPSVAKSCKDIGLFINDRDKTVRDSALNAIVSVYEDIGEITYKHVGKLSDKDLGMLEERIKRSARPKSAQTVTSAPNSRPSSVMKKSSVDEKPTATAETINKKNQQGEDVGTSKSFKPSMPAEVEEILKSIKVINVDHDLLQKEIPTYTVPDWLKQERITPSSKATLDVVISQMVSSDYDSCSTALHQIYAIVKREKNAEKSNLLDDRLDRIVESATLKFRILREKHLPKVSSSRATDESRNNFLSLCKSLLSLVNEIYETDKFASKLHTYTLFDFMRSICQLMVSEQLMNFNVVHKTTSGTDSDQHYAGKHLQRSMNFCVLNMVKNCNKFSLASATVKLMEDAYSKIPYIKSFYDKGEEISAKPLGEYLSISYKCLLKTIKKVINIVKDQEEIKRVDLTEGDLLAELLFECDEFWKKYPNKHAFHDIFTLATETSDAISSKSRSIASSVPKALTTLITNLCNSCNDQVIQNLYQINLSEKSEIIPIIAKLSRISSTDLLQKITQDKKENQTMSSSKSKMSLKAKVDDVFVRIRNLQHLDETIAELYQILQENPTYDISPHLDKMELNCMRDVVRNKLKRLEIQNSSLNADQKRSKLCEELSHNWNPNDEINILRAKCGLDPITEKKEEKMKILQPTATSVNSKHLIQPTRLSTIQSSQASSSQTAMQQPTALADLRKRYLKILDSKSDHPIKKF